MRYIIRPMTIEDIPQVSEIERQAFPTQSPPTFRLDLDNERMRYIVVFEEADTPSPGESGAAKTEGNLGNTLSRITRLFSGGHSSGYKAATPDRRNIVGYGGLWFMVDEAHIISLAVRETRRRKGIGEMLLISLLNVTMQHNRDAMILEVRLSNMAAQSLYEKYGFTRLGLRRRYYTDNGEDAVLMKAEGVNSASYHDLLRGLKESHIQKHGMMEGI